MEENNTYEQVLSKLLYLDPNIIIEKTQKMVETGNKHYSDKSSKIQNFVNSKKKRKKTNQNKGKHGFLN